jgi:hypothetical protein
MPSPTYSRLLSTVSEYVDGAKAKEVIDRQLNNAGATPDSLTKADLSKALLAVITATKLYVSDQARRQQMMTRIQEMAA